MKRRSARMANHAGPLRRQERGGAAHRANQQTYYLVMSCSRLGSLFMD